MRINAGKEKYIVNYDLTIGEVWEQIEINKHRCVIVMNKQKVVGTVSDGDLRRAILSSRLLITPVNEVMNTNFISLTKDKEYMAEEKCKEKNISLIPIVDEQMILLDIYVK